MTDRNDDAGGSRRQLSGQGAEDRAATIMVRRTRDWVAFIGLAPLVLLTTAGNLLVDYGIAGYAVGYLSVLAWLALPLAIPGLACTWTLMRAWWWLLGTERPLSTSLRNGLLLILVAAGVVIFGILQQYGTTSAPAEWAGLATWMLGASLAAFATSAVILVLAIAASKASTRTRAFKGVEAALIGAAWLVVVFAVPALQYRGHQRNVSTKAAVFQALRVDTTSQDPFIIALCHGDHDKAASLLPTLGEEGAREAATCIPANYARYEKQPGLGEYAAGMRLTLAIEAVSHNDPLISAQWREGRRAGPCTVAEVNLLRRVADVAPDDVGKLAIMHLPTDCVEYDATRTPIWWRVLPRLPADPEQRRHALNRLKLEGMDIDQADADGRTPSIDAEMTKAASAP